MSGGKVTKIHAVVLDRETHQPTARRVTLQPKLTIVAGGAINTPRLLLRSGLDSGGRVGQRTFFHPAVGVAGRFKETIRPFYGAPQSAYSHEFEKRDDGQFGYFFEAAPLHPLLTSIAMGGAAQEHQRLLMNLPNLAAIATLLIDGLLDGEAGGSVALKKDGRLRIQYPLNERHMEGFRDGMRNSARALFAAGAEEVLSFHTTPVIMKSEKEIDKLDTASYEPHAFPVFTFHQMGGAQMGADPQTSVVNPRLRHHEVENLYIVDGSVLPTALGVNPSETIYGIAHWAADHIAAAV